MRLYFRGVQKARQAAGHMVNIEVEIETEEQLREAIAAGADVIMFDNCPPDTVRHFAKLTPANIKTEASGGITLESLPAFKGTRCELYFIRISDSFRQKFRYQHGCYVIK